MTLWIILAAMMLVAVAALVIPALRALPPTAGRADYDLTVYRDQLRDLKADVERGVVTPAEEESARTEISRRMIAAGASAEDLRGADQSGKSARGAPRIAVAVLLVLAVPVVATPIYLLQGSPETPGQPYASRSDVSVALESALPEGFTEGVVRLEARLDEEPDDLEGWIMLGRAFMVLQRYDAAVDALDRAAALSPRNSQVLSLLGEANVFAAAGSVTPAAMRAFEAAITADPRNVAARFYVALERAQAGEVRQAFDVWLALVAESPADAPWMPGLQARLEEAARTLDVDLAAVMPAPLPPRGGISAQASSANPGSDVSDGQGPEIRDMVSRLAARLEEEPDDAEGWAMLGRSYEVLGDREGSRAAYARAADLRPDDVEVLSAYARALLEDPSESAPLPDQVRDIYRRILDLDEQNPEALYFAGLGEARGGNPVMATAYWERLLPLLDPTSQAYAVVQEALADLEPAAQ